MKNKAPIIYNIFAILLPVWIILTAVRLMFTPLYLNYEYNSPGFPEDAYGFSREDRLKWANISMDYLLSNKDITYLSDQKISEVQSLYNPAELSHMVDVKNLLQKAIIAWYGLLLLYILLGLFSFKRKLSSSYYVMLARGGSYTIGFIFVLIVTVILSFNQLFTAFHRLFFTGDSWIFNYSDSLIRLFPLRFWQDAFILVGISSVIISLLLIFIGKKFAKKY